MARVGNGFGKRWLARQLSYFCGQDARTRTQIWPNDDKLMTRILAIWKRLAAEATGYRKYIQSVGSIQSGGPLSGGRPPMGIVLRNYFNERSQVKR